MPTVLITGANRGIGLEFVKQYAAEGWHVHATCRQPETATELNAVAGEVSIHQLDVTDFTAVQQLADQLAGETIDVLLSNAGKMCSHRDDNVAPDVDEWQDLFLTNTIAPVKLAYAFLAHVIASEQKKMAVITSRMGSIEDNDSARFIPYRTSKAAVNMAWKTFGLGQPEIIATMFHPGWVQTDMGGSSALVSPTESVQGLRQMIAKLTPADSGKFYAFDGRELPW